MQPEYLSAIMADTAGANVRREKETTQTATVPKSQLSGTKWEGTDS